MGFRDELTLLGLVLFVVLTVGGMLYFEAAARRLLRFFSASVKPFGSRATAAVAAVSDTARSRPRVRFLHLGRGPSRRILRVTP